MRWRQLTTSRMRSRSRKRPSSTARARAALRARASAAAKSWYNDSYIFAMTRGVADSTMVPAAKAPLFLLTVPLDLVLLPFAAIGGFFG